MCIVSGCRLLRVLRRARWSTGDARARCGSEHIDFITPDEGSKEPHASKDLLLNDASKVKRPCLKEIAVAVTLACNLERGSGAGLRLPSWHARRMDPVDAVGGNLKELVLHRVTRLDHIGCQGAVHLSMHLNGLRSFSCLFFYQ